MNKKLLLIYPKSFGAGFHDMRYVQHITKKSELYMNLALPTIAALTPPGFDIKIIDENVEEINFDEHFDLVGISGYLAHVIQAERIAKEFQSRGILVVCGGPSVSLHLSCGGRLLMFLSLVKLNVSGLSLLQIIWLVTTKKSIKKMKNLKSHAVPCRFIKIFLLPVFEILFAVACKLAEDVRINVNSVM